MVCKVREIWEVSHGSECFGSECFDELINKGDLGPLGKNWEVPGCKWWVLAILFTTGKSGNDFVSNHQMVQCLTDCAFTCWGWHATMMIETFHLDSKKDTYKSMPLNVFCGTWRSLEVPQHFVLGKRTSKMCAFDWWNTKMRCRSERVWSIDHPGGPGTTGGESGSPRFQKMSLVNSIIIVKSGSDSESWHAMMGLRTDCTSMFCAWFGWFMPMGIETVHLDHKKMFAKGILWICDVGLLT